MGVSFNKSGVISATGWKPTSASADTSLGEETITEESYIYDENEDYLYGYLEKGDMMKIYEGFIQAHEFIEY